VHKLLFFPVLLVAGCAIAAAYGAVHNQISYTVSPEFFTTFFCRFHIPPDLRNRVGASLVGVISTWWMGLGLGLPLFLLALMLPGWKAYVKHSLFAVVLVVTTAMPFGLGALAVAHFALQCDRYDSAGAMHDFGYLGGAVGLVVAVVYLIVVRVRMGRTGAGQSS
jgi:hypothetical protein